jgi:phosphatidylinositol alpha-1,6-mannosyltransferase
MNVLIITLDYPPDIGGVASYVYNFTNFYSSKNTCFVYAPRITSQSAEDFDKQSKFTTFRKRPYFNFIWPQWLRMLWQVYFIVKKNKIEVIHIHQVLPVGYIGFLIKKFLKIPFFIFLHGSDVQHASATASKRKKFLSILKEAERVFVNSFFLKQEIIKLNPSKRVDVLYPCPGEQFFKNPSPSATEQLREQLGVRGKKIIITPARIVEGKGHIFLAKILSRIIDKIPNLVWLIVGDGNMRDELMLFLQKNSLLSSVRFLGSVASDRLPELYTISDICVLVPEKTAKSNEGFGTVYLEAALCSVPVVGSNIGGIVEAVSHMETGIIVEPNNEVALISTIIELLNNSAYAKQMGGKGRARVLEKFTWDIQCKNCLL